MVAGLRDCLTRWGGTIVSDDTMRRWLHDSGYHFNSGYGVSKDLHEAALPDGLRKEGWTRITTALAVLSIFVPDGIRERLANIEARIEVLTREDIAHVKQSLSLNR